MIHFSFRNLLIVLLLVSLIVQTSEAQSDKRLRKLLDQYGVTPLDRGVVHTPAKIKLGQALFFDRELSGNRDTSCATCHHPLLATGDNLSLPVGTAPQNPGAIGPERLKGDDREFVPRNAPEIFNRGSDSWTSMFWDSRVALQNGGFVSPAGEDLLPGLESVLSVQAMFPVTSRDEMRGRDGDLTFDGDANELAALADSDLHGIWTTLMDRLLAIEEYRDLFLAAYPEKSLGELTFADAANAIAAFETDAFTMLDSPFDRYLAGDDSSLTKAQKRGATLFFDKANCASCHRGPLLTDQQHYGLAVPQLGPGKAPLNPLDAGRFLINDNASDGFAFRTPPLRNVEKTQPYMHNGAFKNLESVVKHHANPIMSLLMYSAEENIDQPELQDTVLRDWQTLILLTSTLDGRDLPKRLNQRETEDLVEFLKSLTAPDFESRLENTIPARVPSGLPVEPNE